jgi:hypothetical protein
MRCEGGDESEGNKCTRLGEESSYAGGSRNRRLTTLMLTTTGTVLRRDVVSTFHTETTNRGKLEEIVGPGVSKSRETRKRMTSTYRTRETKQLMTGARPGSTASVPCTLRGMLVCEVNQRGRRIPAEQMAQKRGHKTGPRETLSESVSVMYNTQPTGMTVRNEGTDDGVRLATHYVFCLFSLPVI